jgi:hypothetical protein
MKSQSSKEKQIIDSEWSRMNEGWRRNAILGASSITKNVLAGLNLIFN